MTWKSIWAVAAGVAFVIVVTWNLDLGPRWYPFAVAALAVPQSWAGGRLAVSSR